MQKPYWQAWRSSFWRRLFTEVSEDHFQLWLWVSLSFWIICLNSSIVFCSIIFIGAITIPGIIWTLERGMGRLYPYLTSFVISFSRMTGFCEVPLWFLNVSALTKSCCCSFLLISANGHLLPSKRKASIWFHRGWSPNTCWRTEGGLNSFPLLSAESCCAFNAFPRLRSYFLNTSKLYAAPLFVNSKLNSGGVGVAQGVLRTALILLKRLLGQSNNGCRMMPRHFPLVALLKYKVSFGTHQVVVLIAVLMTLKLHCNVLFLSVLETLIGEQVGVLVGVLMTLNYHCGVLLSVLVAVLFVLMMLTYHHDVLLVLEVLVGDHWLSMGLERQGLSGCYPFVVEAWLGIRCCLLLPLMDSVAYCSCQKGKVGLVASLVVGCRWAPTQAAKMISSWLSPRGTWRGRWEILLVFCWDVVVCHVADRSCSVVITVSF